MNEDNKTQDPLHGITLQMMLLDIIELIGYKDLYEMTQIRSFAVDYPRPNPVLKFIRKTPWARIKVENIYKENISKIQAMKKSKKKVSKK